MLLSDTKCLQAAQRKTAKRACISSFIEEYRLFFKSFIDLNPLHSNTYKHESRRVSILCTFSKKILPENLS